MLDPAWCDHSMTHWLTLKNLFSQWLMTPTLMLVPLVIVVGFLWLIPRRRWKRLFAGLGIILLVIYFTATSSLTVALASQGLVAFLPKDPGETVDAIVVLGRGDQFRASRVEVAAKLWQAHRAPLIFASGAGDASQTIELLTAEGIPNQALAHEDCSRTTKENAEFTAAVLQPQGVRKILLVTDPPHLLRSLLTFRHFGFQVIPHTSPLPSDLAPKRKALMVFYEYLAFVTYGLQGRLFPQSIPEVTSLHT